MSDPENTKNESNSEETVPRSSTPEVPPEVFDSANLTPPPSESAVVNIGTTENNTINEEGSKIEERLDEIKMSLDETTDLSGRSSSSQSQVPVEVRSSHNHGSQILEAEPIKDRLVVTEPNTSSTSTVQLEVSGSVSCKSMLFKKPSPVKVEDHAFPSSPEPCIVHIPPVISNTSLTSSRAPCDSESPSRRLLHGWKVAPAPEEVIATEHLLNETLIKCQDLIVYTAPTINNNANANLPENSEFCADRGSDVPELEVPAVQPPSCPSCPSCPHVFQTMGSDSFEMVCRICHDTPSKMSCITPCLCKGSMGVVHRACLERWLSESLKTSCEICGYKYETTRKPRFSGCSSVCAWLKTPVNPIDSRNLLFDIACFFILTPLAIISSWLCVVGARHYTNMSQQDNPHPKSYEAGGHSHRTKMHRYRGEDAANSTWTSVGLLALTGTLLAAYYVWLFVALRYHYQVWKDWKMRNYVVTVLEIPHEQGDRPHDNSTSSSSPTNGNPAVHVTLAPRPSRHRKSNSEAINMNYGETEEDALHTSTNLSGPTVNPPRPGTSGSSRANRNFPIQTNRAESNTSSNETSEGSTGTTSSSTSTNSDQGLSSPPIQTIHRKTYNVPK